MQGEGLLLPLRVIGTIQMHSRDDQMCSRRLFLVGLTQPEMENAWRTMFLAAAAAAELDQSMHLPLASAKEWNLAVANSGPERRRWVAVVLRELAADPIRRCRRTGFRLLRRGGWTVSHKRVQRLWL